MNSSSREEFLADNDKKLDNIRKYGIKQKYEEKIYVLKLTFSIVLSLAFLLVIMFCLYFLSKKNEEVGKLSSIINYKDYEIMRLNSRIECLEKLNTELITSLKEDNDFIKEQYKSFMETLSNCSLPQPVVNNYYKYDQSSHTSNTDSSKKEVKTVCVIF